MENTNEKIVLKTSESQRAANKKYRDKMKSNEEYKARQKVRMQNYYINNVNYIYKSYFPKHLKFLWYIWFCH